ncbi:MAG: tetratricopeptide repeat protein [Gammaproteobacteria bacterium]|nr:tetratricopeptide repeat protein [Gammaproteobacteria bacterium]
MRYNYSTNTVRYRRTALRRGGWLTALMLASITVHAADQRLAAASSYLAGGKYDRAQSEISSFLGEHPDSPRGLFLKGRLQEQRGDQKGALQTYSELTGKFPQLPEPYNNMAAIYVSQGNLVEAERTLKRALQTHPSYAAAQSNLSALYMLMASNAYREALEPDQRGGESVEKVTLTRLDDLLSSSVIEEDESAAPAVTSAGAVVTADQGGGVARAEDVIRAVQQWAQAWSQKDVKGYLASYAESFQPPDGGRRAAWEQERSERLQRPRSINVSVNVPQVHLLGNAHASVVFMQAYKSDRVSDTVRKHLLMERSGDQWRILFEDVIQ